MKCPVDSTLLVIAERQGIEIDHCPACRGVWLDRGELDKLIERTADFETTDRVRSDPPDDPGGDDDERTSWRSAHPPKRKRKSFLGDLFELGG